MIPSSIAESTIQALDGLAAKGPPNGIAQAIERIKKVVTENGGDQLVDGSGGNVPAAGGAKVCHL